MEHDPAALITERREQLARYRAAYAETYGRQLDAAKLEAEDGILRQLLGGEELAPGHRVRVDAVGLPDEVAQLAGLTGVLESTADGWAITRLDVGGHRYRVPTRCVRVTS